MTDTIPSTAAAVTNENDDGRIADASDTKVRDDAPKVDPSKIILKGNTLQDVVDYFKAKEGGCKKVVVLAGAGISTSAGIPDFRTPGTGLYSNLAKYKLPFPEAVFHKGFYLEVQEPFLTLATELWPGNFKPTPTHYFIKMLEKQGRLVRVYTQNIDTLERRAGIDPDLIVESHGSFATASCMGFHDTPETADIPKHFSGKKMKEMIDAYNAASPEDKPNKVPRCECGRLVKPDITFFGESLPKRFLDLRSDDMLAADLVLILGTSLKVSPFNRLPLFARDDVPRLLINLERVGEEGRTKLDGLEFVTFEEGGKIQEFQRDAFHLEATDAGTREFARLMGWEEELDAVIREAELNPYIDPEDGGGESWEKEQEELEKGLSQLTVGDKEGSTS
ncbi:NAD-dependent protein deacetylase sirtuin-2 [Phlyctochytrium bullatum]|nr:NAD-dependent protein deacetylase sirtuin-2 [Phlyctochytrium bullatum]